MGSSSPETEFALPERVALHVVEPSANAGSIAVLLCCADADADALAEQMERLDVPDVRLVAGLERDTLALRDELAAMKQQSLVVVCKTDALGADAVRRAVECFGLRRTWTHRLLVLELTSQHSTSWIGSVHRTLAAMARRRSRPTAANVEIASVQGEIHGSTREAARAPSSDEPAVVLGNTPPSNARRDEVGPIPAYVRAPGKRPAHLALVVVPLEDGEEPAAKSDACLVPPVVPAAPRRRSRMALPAGVAAILTAAVVGSFVAPGARVDAPTSVLTTPVQASMPSDVDPIVAMQDVALPAVVASSAPTTESSPPAAQEEASIVVVRAVEDRLEDAIADGRAVRHDGWIIWTEAAAAENWWRAANLCRARTLAGVRGWRLPTIAEARALRKAAVLPKVDSWTLTRVVDGDVEGNWVASADGRVDAHDKNDGSAYAVCIRKG